MIMFIVREWCLVGIKCRRNRRRIRPGRCWFRRLWWGRFRPFLCRALRRFIGISPWFFKRRLSLWPIGRRRLGIRRSWRRSWGKFWPGLKEILKIRMKKLATNKLDLFLLWNFPKKSIKSLLESIMKDSKKLPN